MPIFSGRWLGRGEVTGRSGGRIEHIRGYLVESVVVGSDAEKIGHNRIDGIGLAEFPLNCRGVVTSQSRCLPGRRGADGAEDGFLEDQSRQFEVQVGDDAFGVGEDDQLLGDVSWLLYTPFVVLSVFVWVYPDPTSAQT